jgi:hypothetical protein
MPARGINRAMITISENLMTFMITSRFNFVNNPLIKDNFDNYNISRNKTPPYFFDISVRNQKADSKCLK